MSEQLRMCTVCRKMLPKSQLTRVVKDKQGNIFIDHTNKADGRGAYVCNSLECMIKLKKTKSLNKAFKCQVPDEIYDSLLKIKEI